MAILGDVRQISQYSYFLSGYLLSGHGKFDEQVVVVNHCFTSLLGTNGILSDIVIR